jgi:glucose-6-phosphate 1-epimerase
MNTALAYRHIRRFHALSLTAQFQNFGPPSNDATSKLPQHGFARISKWDYLGKSSSDVEGDSVKLDFGLGPANLSEDSRKAWAYDFGLVYSVTLGKGTLQTMLTVRNEGKEAFEFQMLLHTYFKVKVFYT